MLSVIVYVPAIPEQTYRDYAAGRKGGVLLGVGWISGSGMVMLPMGASIRRRPVASGLERPHPDPVDTIPINRLGWQFLHDLAPALLLILQVFFGIIGRHHDRNQSFNIKVEWRVVHGVIVAGARSCSLFSHWRVYRRKRCERLWKNIHQTDLH
ncbi:hypothetical protein [Yoonia algicola]|uniref:Uncharacterized protein n=1 Tax=Yoonia algicola TaxID=3137368 RepID=A0AAN0M420_9RHOB